MSSHDRDLIVLGDDGELRGPINHKPDFKAASVKSKPKTTVEKSYFGDETFSLISPLPLEACLGYLKFISAPKGFFGRREVELALSPLNADHYTFDLHQVRSVGAQVDGHLQRWGDQATLVTGRAHVSGATMASLIFFSITHVFIPVFLCPPFSLFAGVLILVKLFESVAARDKLVNRVSIALKTDRPLSETDPADIRHWWFTPSDSHAVFYLIGLGILGMIFLLTFYALSGFGFLALAALMPFVVVAIFSLMLVSDIRQARSLAREKVKY